MRALRPYAIASLLLLALGRPAAGDGAEPATLIVANSAHWLPFAFLDHRGEPHGLLIDVWRLAAARSGLQLDPRLVDWEASLALVRDGVVPIHAGMTRTAERAEDYAFSQPILRVRTMVFADRAVELRDLARLENEGIGVVRGTVEEQFLAEHYPHLQIRGFADSDAMVEAAVEGELVGFVADYPSGHYRLIRHEALDRFEAVHSLYTDTIHAAVPRGADDLLMVIDAVLGRVEAEDIAAIERRWLIPGEPWPSWLLPAGGAVLAVFAGLGLLGHERTLRRRVAHRTYDLARALLNLEAANAELDRLANVDPLTGLANRRRFLEVAEQEIARARRHDRTVTLVLLDVDRFKEVNDRLGHPAGDAVLVAIADTAREVLRETDLCARIGGDEFALVLPETDAAAARAVVTRFRERLRQRGAGGAARGVTIEVSAGASTFAGEQGPEAWMAVADRDLYAQKARRRMGFVPCGRTA